MYRLATVHFATDRQTDDNNMMTIPRSTIG